MLGTGNSSQSSIYRTVHRCKKGVLSRWGFWCYNATILSVDYTIVGKAVWELRILCTLMTAFVMLWKKVQRNILRAYQLFILFQGTRVAQWVRSLDLATHTSLSSIRRGFDPGFVNYKNWCARLAAAIDKFYQLLAHGRWFSSGTPASFFLPNSNGL